MKKADWFLIFLMMLLYVFLLHVFPVGVWGDQKPGDQCQAEVISWLEKHRFFMNEALEAAEWIAGSDKEALGVLTNFKKNAILITPTTSSILKKDQLGFLSLAEGDENIWREEFETPILAGFSSSPVSLVFVNNHYKPTRLALGLSLIQEILFAISAPVGETDFFRVQAMAYDMSYRLMYNKFGWRYRRLVQEEQECLRTDPPIALKPEVIKNLEELFGHEVSEVEREFQMGLIWIHAQFQLLAEEYPNNIRAKINFLSILHEDYSVAEN